MNKIVTDITKCSHGHSFVALDDHPRRDGELECPACMSISITQFNSYIDMMEKEDE